MALRALDHRLQQDRGTTGVDVSIVGDLVHALADPDPSRKVDHGIDAGESTLDHPRRANIADDQLDPLVQIGRGPALCAVDLRVEIIERPDPPPLLQQQRGAMRGNKAGAASDQDGFAHSCPALRNVLCGKRGTYKKVQTFWLKVAGQAQFERAGLTAPAIATCGSPIIRVAALRPGAGDYPR